VVEQRKQIVSETAHAKQLSFASRGAAATGLSLLGVRGATLAANSAFLAGAAAVALFAKSLQSFAQFEAQLNTFQVVAGATAEQMERVSAAAVQLGADVRLPSVSAADAAEAMTELAKAGLDVEESIAGAAGVLQLAVAAQISNAEAAEITASALNAFGLAGDQAVHVADLLANAANAAQGSIVEMNAGLAQVSAVARQAGISIANTVAFLTIFAQNGLRGSDAGTSLRTSLIRLIAPTAEAAGLIKTLGLNVRDAQGNIRPDIFAQFGEATAGLPPQIRDFIAATIAGQDAIRAFAIGAREGRDALELTRLKLEQEGTAALVASARTRGLAGSFSAAASNAETLGTTLGGIAAGPVNDLVEGLDRILVELNLLFGGDFGGFLQSQFEDINQAGADFEHKGQGILRVLKSFTEPDFGKSADELAAGLRDIVGSAPNAEDRIAALTKQFDELQKLRILEFELKLPIGQLTRDIELVRDELKGLGVDVGGPTPLTAFEKATKKVQTALKESQRLRDELLKKSPTVDTTGLDQGISELQRRLKKAAEIRLDIKLKQGEKSRLVEIGADTSGFDRDIKALQQRSRNALLGITDDAKKILSGADLGRNFRIAFKTIADAPEEVTPDILNALKSMIRQIGSVAPLSGEQGQKIGGALIKQINTAVKEALKVGDTELAAELVAFANRIAGLFQGSMQEAFSNVKVPLSAEDIAAMLVPAKIKVARSEAFGTVADQIAAHQQVLAELTQKLKSGRAKGDDLVDLLNQITAEQQAIATLTKQRSDDIKEARDKRDDALLSGFDTAEQRIQNQLIIAKGTERLADDIKFTLQLRNLYRREIAEAKTRIRDAEKRTQTVLELEAEVARANQDLAELRKDAFQKGFAKREERIREQLAAAQATETLADDIRFTLRLKKLYQDQINQARQRALDAQTRNAIIAEAEAKRRQADRDLRELRKQKREQFRASIELDIELAQTRENVAAEIRERQKLITALKQEQRMVRRGSVEWKRLRNEIAAEQKAIKDLQKQNEERRDAARDLFFSFLQAQQGFAANLFGNLIPLGAGGLVGNTSPTGGGAATPLGARPRFETGPMLGAGVGGRPSDALDRAAATGAARTAGGMTAGQAATMIKLMGDLLIATRALNRGNAHPEARHERQRQASAMDVHGIGGV
jgi:TP901 family phage tail tape measure protein